MSNKKLSNSLANFKMEVNPHFLAKAEQLQPQLYHTEVPATTAIDYALSATQGDYVATAQRPFSASEPLSQGSKLVLDFKDHCVGQLHFKVRSVGSPADAPLHLRIKLGERLCELGIDSASYTGKISSSWIQEEFLHVDVMPATITLPRRYAWRYVEFTVLDTSPKYQVVIEEVAATTVSSAPTNASSSLTTEQLNQVSQVSGLSTEAISALDRVAIKTLAECMQSVFEDGPKRDRRLWIGDLRLEALANYYTFKQNDLVARCLYLFAGAAQNEQRVGANLFIQPQVQVDDTYLFDYALFFVSCLHDYFVATGDEATLKELYATAKKQIDICARRLDDSGLVADSDDWWCFIDWQDDLNKQASAQAIFIYALRQTLVLSTHLGLAEDKQYYEKLLARCITAAQTKLFATELGFFVSGADKQISYASQAWMVLAHVMPVEQSRQLLKRLEQERRAGNSSIVSMVTPYMYHHYVEALFVTGLTHEAWSLVQEYWGAMIADGADCFYELFDPRNKQFSPYGSPIINSYCHAWSCTPTYFIRKYALSCNAQ